MNCPKCARPMRERERDTGREVVVMDVCPNCDGVWLDKGELEKLASAEKNYYDAPRRGRGDDEDDDEGHGGFFGGQRGRGRGGFLGGIFGGFDD